MPFQKYIEDLKGKILTADEIKHYQRVIVALVETARIMKEIDQIDFLPKESEART